MKIFVILIVLYSVDRTIEALPPTIPRCRRDDPNMSQCIVKVMEKIRPNLASGDFGGGHIVKKLEPLYFKEMNFGETAGLKTQLHDVYIHGASNFIIEKLRVNMKDLKFDVLVTLPTFKVISKYQMQFNFLGNNLKSSGDYFAEHIGGKIILPLRARRLIQNGIEVVKFEPIALKFDQGKIINIKMTNFFGGNKSIEEVINALILNNQEYAFKNVNPQIESKLSKVFLEIANEIVGSSSLDDLFPL